MLMSGTKDARLHQVQLVDIHGTRFYDLTYSHDDTPAQLLSARLGVEDVYPDPQLGDQIAVRYLMNVAVGVARRA